MADISNHMTTAFRVPQLDRGEYLWCAPPRYHYLPWMCGGLGHLYNGQKKSTSQENISCATDQNGCFSPKEKAPLLAKRYQVIEEIGRGASAVVVKARDTFKRGDSFVAIKILNVDFFDLGYQESNCIRRLNQADPGGFSGAIRLQNTFQFDKHFCMVYELLQSTPLHHFFRQLEEEQKLPLIRKISIKLLQLLGFLQSQNVIHADLKPENILCDKNGLDGKLNVIDFGNAIHCIYDELALYYDDYELQTITYRAPEVICGLPFGPEVDMWSVGCILAELYIGRPLFFAQSKEGILGKIYQLLGPLPVNIYQRGKFYRSFDYLGGPPQPYIETFNKLRGVFGNACCAEMVSFILGFLCYDAGKRMTVREACQHPFLAPEVAFGFLMQNESGPCYSGGISISPSGYTHSPKMDKELKAKKFKSLQLLRRETNSKTSTEKSARAIAQVSPFSRSTLVEGDEKTDTGPMRMKEGNFFSVDKQDEERNEMEMVRMMNVKKEGGLQSSREIVQEEVDVLNGDNHKKGHKKNLVPLDRSNSAKNDIISCPESQKNGLEQISIARGIVGHCGHCRKEDLVRTDRVDNKLNEIVSITGKVDETESKTYLKCKREKSGGEVTKVDGGEHDVKKRMKFKSQNGSDGYTCTADRIISVKYDDIGANKEFVTMEMKQTIARGKQDKGKGKQKTASDRKRRTIGKLEKKEKIEVAEMRDLKEGNVQRKNEVSQSRCSTGKKEYPGRKDASSPSRKQLAWQVYEQLENEELGESPRKQRKRKSFARQLQFDDQYKITKTRGKRMVDNLTCDLGKFLKETNGQPLNCSRRSESGLLQHAASLSGKSIGQKRGWRKKRRTENADETFSGKGVGEKPGERTVREFSGDAVVDSDSPVMPGRRKIFNAKESPKQDFSTITIDKGTRKSQGKKMTKKNSSYHWKKEQNSLESLNKSDTLKNAVCEKTASKIDCDEDVKGNTSAQRKKRKSQKADTHPPNGKLSRNVSKTVCRKELHSRNIEQGPSRREIVQLLDQAKNQESLTRTEVLKREKIKSDVESVRMEKADKNVIERHGIRNYENNEEGGQQTEIDQESRILDDVLQTTPRSRKMGRRSVTKIQQKKNKPSPECQNVERGQQKNLSSSEEEEEDMVLLL